MIHKRDSFRNKVKTLRDSILQIRTKMLIDLIPGNDRISIFYGSIVACIERVKDYRSFPFKKAENILFSTFINRF